MKPARWQTGQPIKHTQPINAPTSKQWLRQAAILLLLFVLWASGLIILLSATRSSNVAFVVERGTPSPNAPTPTIVIPGASGLPVSFQHDVQPIFDRTCVKCHGNETAQRNLVLTSYNDLMQGSDNGQVIAPDDPANSLLVYMIASGKMPKSGPFLLPAQIQTIVDWVREGAPNN